MKKRKFPARVYKSLVEATPYDFRSDGKGNIIFMGQVGTPQVWTIRVVRAYLNYGRARMFSPALFNVLEGIAYGTVDFN